MAVFGDRQRQSSHVAAAGWIEAVHAFHYIPAVISAFLHDVNLLKTVLPDIGNKLTSSGCVEREPPGIAKSKRPYLRQSAAGDEWIVRRNPILQPGAGCIYIDAHHLAQ